MDRRKSGFLVAVAAIVGATLVATTTGARAHGLQGRPLEITGTAKGQELVRHAAQQFAGQGLGAERSLHAWELAPGDYVVGEVLPLNLTTTSSTDPNGRIRSELTFDVGASAGDEEGRVASAGDALTATIPYWTTTSQGCFAWIRNYAGELLSCFKLRRLVGESNARDFYSLEQFGTVQATPYGKIYDGWVAAKKATASAPMAWEDWDPVGDLISGTCMIQPLSINILGAGLSTSGLLCERWDMTLYVDPGHFKQQWSCGCLWPFGQPYPNSRGMRYVQGISVPGGGNAIWTLSAGFLAV